MEGVFIFICIPMQLQTVLWYSYECEIILHYIVRNEILILYRLKVSHPRRKILCARLFNSSNWFCIFMFLFWSLTWDLYQPKEKIPCMASLHMPPPAAVFPACLLAWILTAINLASDEHYGSVKAGKTTLGVGMCDSREMWTEGISMVISLRSVASR
jgi:hypothetical protein